MLVVCDSSPLIALHTIEMLHLLPAIYKEIILPKSVFDEIIQKDKPGAKEFATMDWFVVQESNHPKRVKSLLQMYPALHQGEAEAITIAHECKANFVVMDEKLGRTIAAQHAIMSIGVLGILIEAKKRNHIDTILPYIHKLQQIGFRLDNKTIFIALERAGEM